MLVVVIQRQRGWHARAQTFWQTQASTGRLVLLSSSSQTEHGRGPCSPWPIGEIVDSDIALDQQAAATLIPRFE